MGSVLPWLFALTLPPVVFFFLSLVFGFKQKPGFSLLTGFPQELFEGSASLGKVLFYCYCGFDAIAASFLVITNQFHPQLLAFSIIFLVVGVLKNVALAAVISVPAYEFKPHLFAFTSFGGMQVLSCALGIIVFANLIPVSLPLAVTFCVLLGVVALCSGGFLVNPRLSHWTELVSKIEEDGTVVTYRPKPFVLAFTEWMLIILSFAGTIVSVVGFGLLALAAL